MNSFIWQIPELERLGGPVECQFGLSPPVAGSFSALAIWLSINAENCSGVIGAGSMPTVRIRRTTSGSLSAVTTAALSVITIARGLLANPDMVQRFAEGRNAPARPCTYCNKCLVNALLQPLACWEESRFSSREQMFEEAYRVYKEAAVGTVHDGAGVLS